MSTRQLALAIVVVSLAVVALLAISLLMGAGGGSITRTGLTLSGWVD